MSRTFRVLLGWPEVPLPPGGWLGDGGGGRPLVLAHAAGIPVATNERRTVHVVLAGTIANRRDLRASLLHRHAIATPDDAELVAHLYEERGPGALSTLRGPFAVALVDDRHRRMLLARDPLGAMPLFWTAERGRFAAAPSLRLLAELPGIGTFPDLNAFDVALALGSVPPPATLLPGIRQLWPGECLLLEDGRMRPQRYWQPTFPERRRPIPDLPRLVRGQLVDAMRVAFGAEAPALLLSGGFAAAVLLALAADDGRPPARAWTVTLDGAPDAEARAAARLAERAGVAHALVAGPDAWADAVDALVAATGAPCGAPEDVLLRAAATAAGADGSPVVAGVGAREVLGGSMPALAMARAEAYRQLPALLREGAELALRVTPVRRAVGLRHRASDARLAPSELYARAVTRFAADQREELYSDEAFHALTESRPGEVLTRLFADAASAGATDPADAIHWSELVLRLPARVAALTAGVEADVRLPFVDHRLAQFVTGLVPPERTDRRVGCPALREAVAGLVPDGVRNARHTNPLRAAVWASPGFREFCRETLSPERLAADGVFRPETVERLWAEHTAGRADHAARLWALVLATRWIAVRPRARDVRPEPDSRVAF